jgi:predicted nucleic acid-binding protein
LHYFIDTSFFVAIANPKDKYYKQATRQLKKIAKEDDNILTTSDYVVDEFLHIVMRIEGMEEAIKWSKEIIDNKFCNIMYCNKSIFTEALLIFRKERNERKPMTITDCVVYTSQERLSCDEILTFDDRLKNYSK